MFDGEEEAGSRNLAQYMEIASDVLEEIDIWLFFDGPAHASGRPQLVYGVRGASGMEVTVYGALRNLHSGHYGNWAPDTGNVLAHLLASMKDEDGNVLVEGWYDTFDPIGPEEQAALDAMPDWDDQLKEELGLVRTEVEPESLPERLLVPALNVRGITSGNTGSLARNVIPNTAVASLGIRMVKGNTAPQLRELIVNHIEQQGFHIVEDDPDMETRLRYPRIAKVTGGMSGSVASRTTMANPFAQTIQAAASAAAFASSASDRAAVASVAAAFAWASRARLRSVCSSFAVASFAFNRASAALDASSCSCAASRSLRIEAISFSVASRCSALPALPPGLPVLAAFTASSRSLRAATPFAFPCCMHFTCLALNMVGGSTSSTAAWGNLFPGATYPPAQLQTRPW